MKSTSFWSVLNKLKKEIRDKEQNQPYSQSAKQRESTYYLNAFGYYIGYYVYIFFPFFLD